MCQWRPESIAFLILPSAESTLEHRDLYASVCTYQAIDVFASALISDFEIQFLPKVRFAACCRLMVCNVGIATLIHERVTKMRDTRAEIAMHGSL
jgi:hypothetical protein